MAAIGLIFYFIFKKKWPNEKFLKSLFWALIFLFLAKAIFLSAANWILWQSQEITQKLLPPFSPLSYYFSYIYYHCFAGLIFSLFFSLVVYFAIKLINGLYFYDEEKWLAAIGILISHWPVNLFYLALCFLFLLFLQLAVALFKNNPKILKFFLWLLIDRPLVDENMSLRLPFVNLWIPLALISLILRGIILKWLPIAVLNF